MAAPESTVLTAEGLYVLLGGLPVLRDVRLHVERGQVVAVVGGNGSGKTTLIRAVTGLVPIQQGRVELFGTPIKNFKQWQRIGYVPQHASLNIAQATVGEVVATGRLPHLKPFQPMRKVDRAAVRQALEQVQLRERIHWPYHQLSGGQKQRTLIARALATGSELLVMDEPFAGVDAHSQESVAEVLAPLKNRGLGILVVLHERGAISSLIDDVVTLCDGRIVEDAHA